MSCIIGLVQDGKLYMASDGIATTADGEKRPIVATKIHWNGNYLIGYSGGVRTGQLVAEGKLFAPPKEIINFPEAIREHLQEHGSMMVDDAQLHIQNCNFLIGYEGKLWEILVDFQLNEVYGEYTAIGSGAAYAMGSLFSTKDEQDPEKRLTLALQAACEYDMSCGLPFTIESVE